MYRIIALALFSQCLFSACETCNDESIGKIDFEKVSLSYLDLQGTEKLYFRNTNNQMITFVGKKHTTSNRVYRGVNCTHREFGTDGNHSTRYYNDGTPVIYQYQNESFSTLHFAFSVQSLTYPHEFYYDFVYVDLVNDTSLFNATNSLTYASIKGDSAVGIRKVISARGFENYLDASFYRYLINNSQDSAKELVLLGKVFKDVTFNFTADGHKVYFAPPIGVIAFEDKSRELWVFDHKE